MLEQLPVPPWLPVAIAAIAVVPARYVYRYFSHAPSRRDPTRPPEDLSWRTPERLAPSLIFLGTLAAVIVLLLVPAARTFMLAAPFWRVLLMACGAWALAAAAKAFSEGRIAPLIPGLHEVYDRETRPAGFAAAVAGTTLFGGTCLWLAFQIVTPAFQLLGHLRDDRCLNPQDPGAVQQVLAACNEQVRGRDRNDRQLAPLLAARGLIYSNLGDYRRARADDLEAIRLDPNNSTFHFNLGFVEGALGYKALAIAEYSRAIQLNPREPNAYYNRGVHFLDSDKFDQAIADFSRAHEADPNDSMALVNRAISYACKGDQARAERDLAAARAIGQSDPETQSFALHAEAILSMKRGDVNAEIQQLTAALRINARDDWALSMRADAYKKLGDFAKMRADTEAYQRLTGDQEAAR